jgi:3-oxoacyl-[acyl-carrier protein] reductase
MSGVAEISGQPVAEVLRTRASENPAGRFGSSDEFGATCAFICSAHAGYLVGQNILLDGGAFPGTL